MIRDRLRGGGGESGQITLLSLGFAVVALALILVVASASSIHLERKRLLALADGAAADAADAIDEERYYRGELAGVAVPLSDESVRAVVERHLDAASAQSRFEGIAVSADTGSPDGRSARVTLTAVVRPPVVPWLIAPWSDGFRIHVTSVAQAEERAG